MTFFSDTDTATLREEGNERNCFVSLIVNNAGTYSAAITRKVTKKVQSTLISQGASYEFFGNGTVTSDEPTQKTETKEETTIEYFMLDVEVEKVTNPMEYLDTRFEEIRHKKATTFSSKSPNSVSSLGVKGWYGKTEEPALIQQSIKEPSLWDDAQEVNYEPVSVSTTGSKEWQPNPKDIHRLVTQLVLCSFIVNEDKIDLDKWIKQFMGKKYDFLFEFPESFDCWKDFAVEFLLNGFYASDAPEELYEGPDGIQSIVATAMYRGLSKYSGTNNYIDGYLDTLKLYM